MTTNELFPIVDLDGNVTGCATRAECHSGSMLLHPVVHLHVIDKAGCIYLQKRSMNKDIQPGRWDTAVGGHVDYGETVLEALERESFEELGIRLKNVFHLTTYDYTSDREHELIHAYCMIVDRDNFEPVVDLNEISEARFWTIEEIDSLKGQNIFTPNFVSEIDIIRDIIFARL